MDLNDNPNITGAINGLWQGQHARLDELESRLVERQFPDRPLQPQFEFRPVATKYSNFPLVDLRAKSDGVSPYVPIIKYDRYDTATNFSPATRNGPTDTYLANIDVETVLQNRHVALQHGADQGVYVPSSKSDMYGFSAAGRQEDMGERSLIFDKQSLATKVPEVANKIGRDVFQNNTRTQLRGL
jgi:hypothetical protein